MTDAQIARVLCESGLARIPALRRRAQVRRFLQPFSALLELEALGLLLIGLLLFGPGLALRLLLGLPLWAGAALLPAAGLAGWASIASGQYHRVRLDAQDRELLPEVDDLNRLHQVLVSHGVQPPIELETVPQVEEALESLHARLAPLSAGAGSR